MINNLVKTILEQGGSIHPLLIPSEDTNGTGLCNPSIFIDQERIFVNLRHVQYTMYHSENEQKHPSRYGPLSYINPEDDITLRTKNFILELNEDLTIKSSNLTDTTKLDVPPIWEFIGLEDARIVKWDNKWYQTGVRRDTTTNGQGRMELSEIEMSEEGVKEISRWRIPAPGNDDTYCEKNWMPINDMPYHYVKWTNPTEVVKVDPINKTCETVVLKTQKIDVNRDLRGGSSIIKWGDYRIGITHEVDFWYTETEHKDCYYYHRFIIWDKDWNIVKHSDCFNFMTSRVEFSCGLIEHKNDFLITFGFQDNAAYVLRIPKNIFENIIGFKTGFNWGELPTELIGIISEEIFQDKLYEKYNEVKEGDIVMDIGANVGAFSYSILDKKPKKIYSIEPSNTLIDTLKTNLQDKATIINKAISESTGTKNEIEVGVHIYNNEGSQYETITFKDLIKENKIKKIDFLKIDCEGGEYDVFNNENKDWILKNIKYITGEWHLWGTQDSLNKFKSFRDTYLTEFTDYKVFSRNNEDITDKMFDDDYLLNYSHGLTHSAQVLIYIKN